MENEEKLRGVARDVADGLRKGEGSFITLVHKKLRDHGIFATEHDRGFLINFIGSLISLSPKEA